LIRYLTLAEFFLLAEEATGVEANTLIAVSRIELADSALHAPSAEFAGREFYPEAHDKAAVLVSRLARNHPLPDGNKRAAWLSLAMFIELNGGTWQPDPPEVDEAEAMMLAVAAGEVEESWIANWLRERVSFV
jgi:death-on-curing protein